jgi:hydroxymethylglutaryl-CoA reductase (NADPH)
MNECRPTADIPMQSVGPVRIAGPVLEEDVRVPLATLERPLWPSVSRGAAVSRLCGGIRVVVADERMTRSLLFEAPSAALALEAKQTLEAREPEVRQRAESTTRYGRFLALRFQMVGPLLFIRLEMTSGDASGHNMLTLAADRLCAQIPVWCPHLRYVSISGNYCCDKKVSAVNGILGRGRYAVAELTVPAAVCAARLKTTPARVAALNVKKNLVGSILAGGVRSANAHYANLLLAFYLATGQDAANIVEGSQGITYAAEDAGGLYFSVTLPNLILGAVGSGKDAPFARENLARLGCAEARAPGENARRLAAICAATVLCGELSLLAAQTNPGELMRAHETIERKHRD